MSTPEIKQEDGLGGEQTPAAVTEQQAEVPKELPVVEEQGVLHTPGQIAAQVADDTQIQQPVAAAATHTITITIPATTQQLEDWSKGTPDNALTWFAFYWIRMIKKAILHGWGVITQPSIPSHA